MAKRRGNPNWGRVMPPAPILATEFEERVQRLGLSTRNEYVLSTALKHWCSDNRNRVYVPEWLLNAWGIKVNLDYGSVA